MVFNCVNIFAVGKGQVTLRAVLSCGTAMTSKVIYFTVGGFPEQAEFSSDDTLEDVRGDTCTLASNVILVINCHESDYYLANKLLSSTRNLKYEEHLKILNLPTLKYRRVRGDMIELYEIITCKQDNAVTLKFNTIPAPVTRCNTYKIRQDHV